MCTKKKVSSFIVIFLALGVIGAAETWASVTSGNAHATTGTIKATLPTFKLTLTPVQSIVALNPNDPFQTPTPIGTLTFFPNGDETIGDVAITAVAINSANSVGNHPANDIVLYAKKTSGELDVIYVGNNAKKFYTCHTLPDWGLGRKIGKNILVQISAAFVNVDDIDQTPEAGNVAEFDITGVSKII